MRREEIKSLIDGITDEQLDKIMSINGKDIEKAKGDSESLKTQLEDYKGQITERDNQLKELKKSAKDSEALTDKITELESVNEKTKTEYESKISEMSKNGAIDSALRDAKAKNIKAVKALLDSTKIEYKDDKLVGFDEQIKTLKESDDTKFLFGAEQVAPPAGTNPANPPQNNSTPPTGGGLASAISAALNSNK